MEYVDTQDFSHFSIKAKDGEIGHISDFYFDESFFYLRYLVVDTERFLSKNLVLVSAQNLHKIDLKNKVIHITITKKELEEAPSFESVGIVSRQYKRAFEDRFNIPYFWGSQSSLWTVGPYGIRGREYLSMEKEFDEIASKTDALEDAESCHLRSSKEICNYSVEGLDKTFGNIQGFILNTKSLSIDFIVINTVNYLPLKKILLRPEWLEEISWHFKALKFPFTKELIKSAPAYKKNMLDEKYIKHSDLHFLSAMNNNNRYLNKIDKVSEKEAVVGHIPSGLFIVTIKNEETNDYEGFLASWVQQASFNPLLISLCIKDGRPGIDSILKKEPFCINIIGKDSPYYLTYFKKENGVNTNTLTKIPHQKLEGKGMFINGAKSVIICKAFEVTHPGDHYLITAEVVDGVILNNDTKSKTYLREDGSHY